MVPCRWINVFNHPQPAVKRIPPPAFLPASFPSPIGDAWLVMVKIWLLLGRHVKREYALPFQPPPPLPFPPRPQFVHSASWLRLKYPHIVQGAVAASAPVLALEGLRRPTPNPESFAETVTRAAGPAGGAAEECSDNVRRAFAAILSGTDARNGARNDARERAAAAGAGAAMTMTTTTTEAGKDVFIERPGVRGGKEEEVKERFSIKVDDAYAGSIAAELAATATTADEKQNAHAERDEDSGSAQDAEDVAGTFLSRARGAAAAPLIFGPGATRGSAANSAPGAVRQERPPRLVDAEARGDGGGMEENDEGSTEAIRTEVEAGLDASGVSPHYGDAVVEEGSAPGVARSLRVCPGREPRGEGALLELAWWARAAFDYLSMGNYPYATGYILNSGDGGAELPPWPLRVACSHLADPELQVIFLWLYRRFFYLFSVAAVFFVFVFLF